MSDAAAFKGTIHGFRTVPSRGVVAVTIESPIEHLEHIARVAVHGAWVGVARLNTELPHEASSVASGVTVLPATQGRKAGASPKRSFDEMSPAQQAGMLCNDPVFWRFLAEQYNEPWTVFSSIVPDWREAAGEFVRDWCDVKSRSEITRDHLGWKQLLENFRDWKIKDQVVP